MQVSDHGLAPAPVMGKLEDVRRDRAPTTRRETRGGLGLDVAREQHARTRVVLEPQHERTVVVPPRAESARRPQHRPRDGTRAHCVTLRDLEQLHTRLPRAREQLGRRRHRLRRRDERRMHRHPPHPRVSHHIEQTAVVVEVRMRDHHQVDHTAARGDHRKQRARRHAARRARPSVEEREHAVALDEVRGAIADREHRHREVRRSLARRQREHRRDRDQSRPRARAQPPRPRADCHEHQDQPHDPHRRVEPAHLHHAAEMHQRPVDDAHLHPRGEPQHRPEPRGRVRPDAPQDRLRVRDRERRRRQRRADEGEQRPVGLQRTEVDEHHRHAHHERRDARRDRRRCERAAQPEPRRMPPLRIIARHPREPALGDRPREVTQRHHAQEAELEPGRDRVRWRMHEHRDGREREDRVAMPLAPERCPARPDDRHQRRPDRARRGRHHHQRDRRRDGHRHRAPSLVANEQRRHRAHHPAEDREVEPRDRQDVREPRRAEAVLDRPVSILDVAEHQRDQHRADARLPRLVHRHAGEQRLAHAPAEPLPQPVGRIRERRRRAPSRNGRRELARVERQRPDDAARRGHVGVVDLARQHRTTDRREAPGDTQPVADRPGRRVLRHAHREQRGRMKPHPRSAIVDQHHLAHETLVLRRLAEVAREDIGAEPRLRRARGHRDFGHDDLRFTRLGREHRSHHLSHRLREPKSGAEHACDHHQQDDEQRHVCFHVHSHDRSHDRRRALAHPSPPQQASQRARREQRSAERRPRERPSAFRELDPREARPIGDRTAHPQRRREQAGRDGDHRARIERLGALAQRRTRRGPCA